MSEQLVQAENASKENEEGIHLFVENTEATDSVIAIRWCICKSLDDELKKRKVENPFLLLVVVDELQREERRLVPLEQAMEYIQFRRPGAHKILATTVWSSANNGSAQSLKNSLLKKTSKYTYDEEVLSFHSWSHVKMYKTLSASIKNVGEGVITVVVGEEFFAKDPPKWLKRWVELWCPTTSRDQCQFRKRLIVAFIFKPPAVLLWIVFLCLFRFLVAVFLILCGMREVNFASIIHPFRDETKDIWCDLWSWFGFNPNSVFLYNKERNRYPTFCLVPFTPIIPLTLFGIFCAVKYLFALQTSIWTGLAGVAVIVLLVAVTIALIELITLIFSRLVIAPIAGLIGILLEGKEVWSSKKRARKAEELKKQVQVVASLFEKKHEARFSDIICTGIPLRPKLNHLSRRRRTFHLRFHAFKKKVCRPFAEK